MKQIPKYKICDWLGHDWCIAECDLVPTHLWCKRCNFKECWGGGHSKRDYYMTKSNLFRRLLSFLSGAGKYALDKKIPTREFFYELWKKNPSQKIDKEWSEYIETVSRSTTRHSR